MVGVATRAITMMLNPKNQIDKDWSEISGTDIFLISFKTICTTNMNYTAF